MLSVLGWFVLQVGKLRSAEQSTNEEVVIWLLIRQKNTIRIASPTVFGVPLPEFGYSETAVIIENYWLREDNQMF